MRGRAFSLLLQQCLRVLLWVLGASVLLLWLYAASKEGGV